MIHRKSLTWNPPTPLTPTPSLTLIPIEVRGTNCHSRMRHILGLQLSLNTTIQTILRIRTLITRIRRHIPGRSNLTVPRLPVAVLHDTKIISIFSPREELFWGCFGLQNVRFLSSVEMPGPCIRNWISRVFTLTRIMYCLNCNEIYQGTGWFAYRELNVTYCLRELSDSSLHIQTWFHLCLLPNRML
jgi:hypothetical protein